MAINNMSSEKLRIDQKIRLFNNRSESSSSPKVNFESPPSPLKNSPSPIPISNQISSQEQNQITQDTVKIVLEIPNTIEKESVIVPLPKTKEVSKKIKKQPTLENRERRARHLPQMNPRLIPKPISIQQNGR